MGRRRRDDDYDDYDEYDDRPRRRRRDDYYDDDDDYDDRPRQRPRVGRPKTATTITSIIGCIVLVALGVWAVQAFRSELNKPRQNAKQAAEQRAANQQAFSQKQQEEANSDKGQAKSFGEQFMQELKGSRFEAAYKLTTEDYQKRVTEDDFTAKIKKALNKYPHIFPLQDEDVFGPNSGKTFAFKTNLGDPRRGFKQLSLTIVKSGDGWRVDRFIVGDEDDDS
jgi:hypothetical protein